MTILMIEAKKFHSELVKSKKKNELTPKAKSILIEYTNDVKGEIFPQLSKMTENELLEGGREFVFKHWHNFNCEKHDNPLPYFKLLFKHGVINYDKKNSREYKEERFLESLRTMGRKILKFNLPYEIELDGPTIRKFSYVDKKE